MNKSNEAQRLVDEIKRQLAAYAIPHGVGAGVARRLEALAILASTQADSEPVAISIDAANTALATSVGLAERRAALRQLIAAALAELSANVGSEY